MIVILLSRRPLSWSTNTLLWCCKLRNITWGGRVFLFLRLQSQSERPRCWHFIISPRLHISLRSCGDFRAWFGPRESLSKLWTSTRLRLKYLSSLPYFRSGPVVASALGVKVWKSSSSRSASPVAQALFWYHKRAPSTPSLCIVCFQAGQDLPELTFFHQAILAPSALAYSGPDVYLDDAWRGW